MDLKTLGNDGSRFQTRILEQVAEGNITRGITARSGYIRYANCYIVFEITLDRVRSFLNYVLTYFLVFNLIRTDLTKMLLLFFEFLVLKEPIFTCFENTFIILVVIGEIYRRLLWICYIYIFINDYSCNPKMQ